MMKRILLFGLALAAFCASASAQEEGWRKSFSLEISTGFPPVHSTLGPSTAEKYALADIGLSSDTNNAVSPVINISGRFRVSRHSEILAGAGATWSYFKVTQYNSFGINPDGSPRYNLNSGHPAGWRSSKPMWAIAVRYHYIWSPDWRVKWFSGLGAGVVLSGNTDFTVTPVPEITFIGLRREWEHFYILAESSIGPMSTFLDFGLGWIF